MERFAISTSTPVSDWPTSSCSSREIERRSFSCASTSRAESCFNSSAADCALGFRFQPRILRMLNAASTMPEPDRQADGERSGAGGTAGRSAATRSLARVELRLVHARRSGRRFQHRHAPRKYFVAQKGETAAPALSGVPRKDRIERFPVFRQVGGQGLKRRASARAKQRGYCASAPSMSLRVSSRL